MDKTILIFIVMAIISKIIEAVRKASEEQQARQRSQPSDVESRGRHMRPRPSDRPRPGGPPGGGSPLDQLAEQLQQVLQGAEAARRPVPAAGRPPALPVPAAAVARPAPKTRQTPADSQQQQQQQSRNQPQRTPQRKRQGSSRAKIPEVYSGNQKTPIAEVANPAAVTRGGVRAADIHGLLQSPHGMAQAMILQEVLQRPRILRRAAD